MTSSRKSAGRSRSASAKTRAAVKNEWRGESLGWFDATDALIGAGLVLYRKVPKLKRFLAYLPEGPALDWVGPDLHGQLAALETYLDGQRAFAMGVPAATALPRLRS